MQVEVMQMRYSIMDKNKAYPVRRTVDWSLVINVGIKSMLLWYVNNTVRKTTTSRTMMM